MPRCTVNQPCMLIMTASGSHSSGYIITNSGCNAMWLAADISHLCTVRERIKVHFWGHQMCCRALHWHNQEELALPAQSAVCFTGRRVQGYLLGMWWSQLKSASIGCGFYRSKSVRCGYVGAQSKYNIIP